MVNGYHVFGMYIVVRSQNQKEKASEEVVAIPFIDYIETTMNDFKKKKQKKSEWEVNRMYQDH
jgi:hypothetical protein